MSRQWLCHGRAVVPDTRLPHCWNAEDSFQEGVAYYRGPGSYRRVFQIPDTPHATTGMQWILESDGFYGTGEVFLNGRSLGKVDGQYLGFRLDATAALDLDGPNVLGVRLTNRCRRNVLPGIRMPDFLLYGGLAGDMRLVGKPVLRLDEHTLAVRCTDVNTETARVTLVWNLKGAESVQPGDAVEWRLKAPDGHETPPVTQLLGISQNQGITVFDLAQPQLWCVEAAACYKAQGRLLRNGRQMDACSQSFGIRHMECRPGQGFFLNGRRVALRGCNRHESMPGFGSALPRWQHAADARLIKAMGLNFVRLSHYPQHPAFLEACDTLGILVYAEIASWKSVRGGGWQHRAHRQMKAMIERDRNHPSVILWGMGNEGRHAGAFHDLYALCKALDPQRPVTYAENHISRAVRCRTTGIPDVWGLNYEFGALTQGVAASRLQCAVVSECSNYPHARRGVPAAEKIQLETVQADLTRLDRAPAAAGYALWCFNDYATLRKKRYRRFSGVLDAWRMPKAAARWLSETYGDGQLATACRPHGDAGKAAAVAVTVMDGGMTADADYTIAVLATVTDERGHQCAWNGTLTATVTQGTARVCTWDGRGTVWIADGTGALFVRGAGGPAKRETIRLEVQATGLQSGLLEWRDTEGERECKS